MEVKDYDKQHKVLRKHKPQSISSFSKNNAAVNSFFEQNKNTGYNDDEEFLRTELVSYHSIQGDNTTEFPSNGKLGTVFLLLNSMIGSGVLNQPQVFSEAGLVGGLVLYIICCTFLWWAQQLLVQSGITAKQLDYAELLKHCFGKCGGIYMDASIVFGAMLSLSSYLTIIGGEGTVIVNTWFGDLIGKELPVVQVLPALTVLGLLPLCLVRKYGHLAFVSMISIISIVLVIGCVVFKGLSQGVAGGHSNEALLLFSLSGTFRKLGSVLFSFDCVVASFFAYGQMVDKSPGSWKQVSAVSMLLGAFMGLLIGLAGYLSFRGATEGDILDNFYGTFAALVKFTLVLHLVLYFPTSFVIMRHSFARLFLQKDIERFSFIPYAILTLGLLGIPLVGVVMCFAHQTSEGETFGRILDFTGGVIGGCGSLALPGITYLYLHWKKIAKMRLVQGICLVLLGFITTFVVVPLAEGFS
mmetsp:Transcript_2045/g.2747  ORF Transcript_2045/g.2747 Transcript_2045/m.2747 type:complete len:469 (+) Transcript_2045:1-1407(+)